MDEATEQKQTYLRTEIIDKGYDPEVFTAYISNLKGEEGIDLNLWSMEELVNIVKSFQEQQSSNNNVNTNEEYKQYCVQGTSSSVNVKGRLEYWQNIVKGL